ncbi:hypothetical protein Dsin_020608 [Dipteronia sinensis]|uniref:PHD finger transcription factor n=1 Tax=Dipteronia sinensis TaxID=43782 RepID=A0AAE0E3N4_9ROSI|nr:hypothetical protein Dsin_020608 [Dipteronia sinensis]
MELETKKRKRRKDFGQRKLLAGDRVEVRSEEEGFVGSWHPGTVITCSKHRRRVKYDHILKDDESGHWVETVCVSSIIDGACNPDASQCQKRGFIRPFPPPFEFGIWSLRYGLCVDAYYKEAWWEGVIFDHDDGSEERNVFFPDLGDEMRFKFDSLRITQDWDELTEKWHPRGTWLLLELIENYKQEYLIVPVSEKGIWYELRQKEGFEDKEWTSSEILLLEELMLEVIKFNNKFLADHLFQEFDQHTPSTEQETCPLLCNAHAVVPVENPEHSNAINLIYPNIQKSDQNQLIVSVSDDVGPNMILSTESVRSCDNYSEYAHPQPLVVLPSDPDGSSGISAIKNRYRERFYSRKSNKIHMDYKSSKRRKIAQWFPDIVPRAEFCPDVITKYAHAVKRRQRTALSVDVKKHLKHLNWKIECLRDDKNVLRHRYLAPDGKCFDSLILVCLNLMDTSVKIPSSISRDDERVLCFAPDVLHRSLPEQPEEAQGLDHSPLAVDSSISRDDKRVLCTAPDALRTPLPELPEEHRVLVNSLAVDSSLSDVLVVQPEYNPQAIKDWYMHGIDENCKKDIRKSDLATQARKHLSSLGWVFKYTTTGTMKRLYCYSPKGKCYYSLRSACKDILDGKIDSKRHASTCRSKKSSIVHDKVKDQLVSGISSSAQCPCIFLPKKPRTKRKINSSLVIRLRANSNNASLPKSSKALTTLGDDLVGSRQTRSLRPNKRVRELKIPSASSKNPINVLSWLIDNDVVLPRQKVFYRSRKNRRPMAEGKITHKGIKCNCCRKVFTLGAFKVHIGGVNSIPATHIFLKDGRSLLDCQHEALSNSNMRSFLGEQHDKLKGNHHRGVNDTVCSVCHYGGNLILCDGCPSSFHTKCIGLKCVPAGNFFCRSCCCGICGSGFRDGFENVLICYQCERKYHSTCTLERGGAHISVTPSKENWFCSKKCHEIFLGLQKLVGKPIPIGGKNLNLTWTLLKPKQLDSRRVDAYDIECLSKLNIAPSVMHECFEPVEDARTGRDLVEDVIHGRGSELNRTNFKGFYTVLLERNEELVTVANVRVFGEKVAELPLVGTRFPFRRLGMCRFLMNELEKKLMEIGVEKLILPAIPNMLDTWTTSFGFSVMTRSERLHFLDYAFLDFQGTIMCQKLLSKTPSALFKQPRGPQPIIPDESSDTIDRDGSSTGSEVFQTEQVEESGGEEQSLADQSNSKPESDASVQEQMQE